MKIDFCVESKEYASKLLDDKTELSLFLAQKFLEKIPTELSDEVEKRVVFEIASEGFLTFVINARESLLQEINTKLNLGLLTKDVTLKPVLAKLISSESKKIQHHERAYTLLNSITQEPEKVINYDNPYSWSWDRTKSWLWEIAEMRNKISHRSILNQHMSSRVSLQICTLTKQPILKKDNRIQTVPIENPKTETIIEENALKYFTDCFNKFLKMRDDIRSLF